MKLLLDACVWGGARGEIEDLGHDCDWVGDWAADPGDDEILSHSLSHGQILVTLDKDFGELAVVLGRPHAGIVRLVKIRAREQARVLVRLLKVYGCERQAGALLTATRDRVRIRRPDPDG